MCGENGPPRGPGRGDVGSSPRVRGKLSKGQEDGLASRLIPACAGKTRPRTPWTGSRWAHPRVCGENPLAAAEASADRGSSPRVRGKLVQAPRRLPLDRLIPACAGKTPPWPESLWSPTAHPRVCGENPFPSRRAPHVAGSSPRVRGKPGDGPAAGARPRLIPACAGKTVRGAARFRSGGAHPRVCGENVRRALGKRGQWGSSPRVRGKLGVLGGEAEERGLIPACAGKTTSPTPCGSTGRAHPRVCGENLLASALAAWWLGSSPRVRGKRQELEAVDEQPRLIPACAGKTGSWPVRPPRRPAHPRVCGENLLFVLALVVVAGSSPRVRGKPGGGPSRPGPVRLIPACAGKTEQGPRRRGRAGAHPRVCGENIRLFSRSAVQSGSSPRVRGKPQGRPMGGSAGGLIPACAGKTRWLRCWSRRTGAHPRVCGENKYTGEKYSTEDGSSPRVRGKRHHHTERKRTNGLIPACAGKTPAVTWGEAQARAHPRVCGENSRCRAAVTGTAGSSPRVRGKPLRRRVVGRRVGLIPACAGKTACGRTPAGVTGAHPRVCGENSSPRSSRLADSGSSPRVRGKPPLRPPDVGGVGLIPACAGKTASWASPGRGSRAHPRVCGENEYLLMLTSSHGGSSPRVRGKPPLTPSTGSGRGLIPACAGKTPTDPFYGEWSRAHPRVCGENPH